MRLYDKQYDDLPKANENGYTPFLHDPKHKRWIGMGFCIKCGGYGCTTPDPVDMDAVRRQIRDLEDRLDILRGKLLEEAS